MALTMDGGPLALAYVSLNAPALVGAARRRQHNAL